MKRSDSIAALAAALAKAQGEIQGAVKDSTGQVGQQKTQYADLESVWTACRGPLAKNGLSIVQTPSVDGPKVTITTLLLHASGEWIENDLVVLAGGQDVRSIGSAITYGRRYSLAPFVGVAPTADDDGEAASQAQRAAEQAALAKQKMNANLAPGPSSQPRPQTTAEQKQAVNDANRQTDTGKDLTKLLRELGCTKEDALPVCRYACQMNESDLPADMDAAYARSHDILLWLYGLQANGYAAQPDQTEESKRTANANLLNDARSQQCPQ